MWWQWLCDDSVYLFAAVLDPADEALLEDEVVQQPESKRYVYTVLVHSPSRYACVWLWCFGVNHYFWLYFWFSGLRAKWNDRYTVLQKARLARVYCICTHLSALFSNDIIILNAPPPPTPQCQAACQKCVLAEEDRVYLHWVCQASLSSWWSGDKVSQHIIILLNTKILCTKILCMNRISMYTHADTQYVYMQLYLFMAVIYFKVSPVESHRILGINTHHTELDTMSKRSSKEWMFTRYLELNMISSSIYNLTPG